MRPLALVTGSWRRIGAHIAARLAREGYDVALHAAHDAVPEAWLVAALADAGAEHRLFVANLADGAAVAGLIPAATAAFGRPVSLLINNASRFAAIDTGHLAPFDDLVRHFAVNTAAPYALSLAVAAGGGCAVINILDQRIVHPPRDQVAYTLSKQALAEATRTLAKVLAPGVRVNGVAPGLTLATADYDETQMTRLANAMPLGVLAGPEDIADAVAWLAAARTVTGQTIFVDGGASLVSFERDFVHLAR